MGLRSKKSALQNLWGKYLCFWGGDFAPLEVDATYG